MEAVLTTPSGRISLGTTAMKIGSDTSNELVLNDALTSPIHAEITPVEDGYQLTDLDSTRGVLVNGQFLFPHTPQQLQNGDVIVIGKSSLIYKAALTEESSTTFVATRAQTEMSGLAPSREIADQPTDTAIPALPKSATASLPSGPGALPPENVAPISARTTPDNALATVPASVAPSTPISGAPAMQPLSQAHLAQGYAAPGIASYPAFPPAGAISGPLAQPGYPAAYAQGAYAYAPGQLQAMTGTLAAPAPVAQKRERVLRWVIVLVVVVLLLGASNVATYALTRALTPKPVIHTVTFPSPQKALQTYCQGIMTGNSEEIYDLLSDEAKVHTSLDDIQKIFDELKLLNSSSGTINAQYTNCGFDNIRVGNTLAVATVLLSISLTIQFNNQGQKQSETTTETVPSLTSLVWEHNQWKIDVSSISQQQPKLN